LVSLAAAFGHFGSNAATNSSLARSASLRVGARDVVEHPLGQRVHPLEHLAEPYRPPIKSRLRKAWAETDYHRALEQLQRLAAELDRTHPGAAGSLREGMEETLTVIRLGIRGVVAG